MAELTPLKKAFVRHRVAVEFDKRDRERGKEDSKGRKDARSCLTDTEWAEVMGVHPNTAKNYKKDPGVVAAVKRAIEQAETSTDYYQAVLRDKALEDLRANYNKASGNDKRQYLKMILDETRGAVITEDTVDYSEMTDEDLAALCLKQQVTPLGMTQAELKQLAKAGAE